MDCVFCNRKQIGSILIEDDLVFACLTHTPIVPGHTLVLPKRHIKCYEEMTNDERVAMEEMRAKIKGALCKVFHAEGFNYAWNEEEIGGQTIPHFHLHVIPRKQGDAGIYQYEPRKFLYRPGLRETSPAEELAAIENLIKSVL